MEISFYSQFDSTHWALVMTLEPQNFAPVYDAGTSLLRIQVTLKHPTDNDTQPRDLYPVILDLHGKLCSTNDIYGTGATLLPPRDLPISFVSPNTPQLVNLSFAFSTRYLQLLEEQRALQQEQVMILAMQMWGIAAIVRPRTDTLEVPKHLQSRSGEVIRFEKVDTGPSAQFIRIERSAWVDRILPGLGYRHSVLIELPLIRTPAVPEAYQRAAEALDMARNAFNQEDYRGAVKYAREVLEYLGNCSQGKQVTTFCKEFLEPTVGRRKSRMIDRSLNALRDMTNMASHIGPFVADRAIAAYVIETLALNLRYISAVLG
jgi:hypothetical protein